MGLCGPSFVWHVSHVCFGFHAQQSRRTDQRPQAFGEQQQLLFCRQLGEGVLALYNHGVESVYLTSFVGVVQCLSLRRYTVLVDSRLNCRLSEFGGGGLTLGRVPSEFATMGHVRSVNDWLFGIVMWEIMSMGASVPLLFRSWFLWSAVVIVQTTFRTRPRVRMSCMPLSSLVSLQVVFTAWSVSSLYHCAHTSASTPSIEGD